LLDVGKLYWRGLRVGVRLTPAAPNFPEILAKFPKKFPLKLVLSAVSK